MTIERSPAGPGARQDPVPPPAERIRLDGWKAISKHLGRGVRTAQRWEKQFGLPVHRAGIEGEVVFAWAHEVDAWLTREGTILADDAIDASSPVPARRAPTRSHRSLALVAVVLLAVAAAGVVHVLVPGAGLRQKLARLIGPAPQPAGWDVKRQALVVFDADGVELWRHPFEVLEDSYGAADSPGVWIEDLDGDGSREVIAVRRAPRPEDGGLVVFDASGAIRFAHRFDETVRFGEESYAGPWVAYRPFITAHDRGGLDLWMTYVHLFFPTRLVRLAPSGADRDGYWSNGYIEWVGSARVDGRPTVLVGAITNEFRSASLAVFDEGQVGGSAPAENPKYRCTSCAPGGPREFLVFPQLCLGRQLLVGSGIFATRAGPGGQLVVVVRYPHLPTLAGVPDSLEAAYVFDARLTLLKVELPVTWAEVHDRLAAHGWLDHSFGDADRDDLALVRRWDGQRFVDLPPVPVVEAPPGGAILPRPLPP